MGRLLNWGAYCLECQKIDYSNTERAKRFLDLGYYFYLSKFLEFIDTVSLNLLIELKLNTNKIIVKKLN